MIGYGRQMRLQASILVDISFGLVFSGTLTSTYIATTDWDKAPKDFRQKLDPMQLPEPKTLG